jgi:hypothetical protein
MRPPFFIVGCGRSGTTLVRAMLDQHPDLAIPLESLFMIDYLRSPSRDLNRMRRMMVREYELGEWGLHPDPQDLAGCDSARAMIDRLHELYAARSGANRWGQKTPRFVRWGDLLWSHYPQAQFIHVVRDPRAVTSSLMRSDVHRSNAFYAARRWRRDVRAGHSLKQKRPGQTLEVHYEELVRQPRQTLERLCSFLEVSFEPELLDYPNRAPREYGQYYANIHAALQRPPDPARIDAWRRTLSRRQIELVESICGELMEEYGYRRETAASPHRAYRASLRAQRMVGIQRQIAHYLRTRRSYLFGYVKRKQQLALYGDLWRVND